MDENVKGEVAQQFQQWTNQFFAEGIHQQVHQRDPCLITYGDYF
jgi:hypothetical protein